MQLIIIFDNNTLHNFDEKTLYMNWWEDVPVSSIFHLYLPSQTVIKKPILPSMIGIYVGFKFQIAEPSRIPVARPTNGNAFTNTAVCPFPCVFYCFFI